MFTEINGKIIALADAQGIDQSKVVRSLSSGRAVELSDSTGLDPQTKVDLSSVSSKIQTLIGTVKSQFIDRDELIEAFALAMFAGEHAFVLGPPGTAKTAVVSALSKGVDVNLWRVLMNQDTTKDGLLGTIDPKALQNGTWTRRWSSLATADIAIIDEVWKSSGQNANIMLDALEERKVREGDSEHCMPLVSALGMSNEVPEDSERRAIYDRFLIRLTVDYVRDLGNFQSMLTADAGQTSIAKTLTTDELRLTAAAAELIALDPPKAVLDIIKALWREIGQNGRSVSDRRWRKTAKLICAYALMCDETPNARHASVARWTLWVDEDEANDIRDLVMSKADPMVSTVLNLRAKFSDMKKAADQIDPADSAAKSEVTGKLGRLSQEVEKTLAAPGIDRDQLEMMNREIGALIMAIIKRTS